MTLQNLFLKEIEESLTDVPKGDEQQPLMQENLAGLPTNITNYLERCGYLGKPVYENIFIRYEHACIKLKPKKDWLSINCQQLNSVKPPTRLALMQGRLFGFLPIEARDKYQNSHGNMLVKLADITLTNATGKEIDVSSLLTYLAETPLLSAALLNPRITWTETEDEHRTRASITDQGITVSGDFFFNKQGKIIKFVSDERYYSENGKSYSQRKWTAIYDRYRELNGIQVPTVIRAVWDLPDGKEYEYFRTAIKEIKYNLATFKETLKKQQG